MNLGRTIREFRKHRELTQKQLAKKVKISQASFSHIENGKKRPTNGHLHKIAKALGTTTGVLILSSLEGADFPVSEKMLQYLKVLFKTADQIKEASKLG